MNEFSNQPPVLINIAPWSKESMAGTLGFTQSWASAVWPTASKSILYPFTLLQPTTFQLLWIFNGSPVSGNLDLGVYTADGGHLIVHTGAKQQAGIHRPQTFSIPSTELMPGSYLMACVLDNVTGAVYRRLPVQVATGRAEGCYQVTSNFPLAQSITPTAVTSQYLPLCGLSTRSFL